MGALHGDTVQPNQDNLLPTTDGLDNVRVTAALQPGEHTIAIEVEGDGSGEPEQVRLAWMTPDARHQRRVEAVAAAKLARKAVVFAWSRNNPVFGLPGNQDALIDEIASVNPNTIVVLNTSQPVAMPWLGKVKAVLQMWWTGDQGGEATADILLGRVSPAGRLPFTWGYRLTDYPATDPAFPERSSAGVGGVTTYSEGLDVGYRWFDRKGIKPLFPFGFGLSYTRFSYSNLRTRPAADGGMDVSFAVKNAGNVPGDEVSQVYLSAPEGGAPGAAFSVKTLGGFVRTSLQPGQERVVTVHLPLRRFQYWSQSEKAWRTAPGARKLMVGASSQDIRFVASLPPRIPASR